MLALKSQEKIVERVVKTKTGMLVLATFFVQEVNGELVVRLISVRPIKAENGFRVQGSGFRSKTVCLPVRHSKSPAVVSYRHNYHSIISPFVNIFEFFVSQPTRAPSLG